MNLFPKRRIIYVLERVGDPHSFIGRISGTRKSYTQYFYSYTPVVQITVPKGRTSAGDIYSSSCLSEVERIRMEAKANVWSSKAFDYFTLMAGHTRLSS